MDNQFIRHIISTFERRCNDMSLLDLLLILFLEKWHKNWCIVWHEWWAWYTRKKKHFIEFECQNKCWSIIVHVVWTHVIGLLVWHVDDYTYCGTKQFHDQIIEKLKKKIKISAEASSWFKYFGLNKNRSSITINKNQYIQSLDTVTAHSEKQSIENITVV